MFFLVKQKYMVLTYVQSNLILYKNFILFSFIIKIFIENSLRLSRSIFCQSCTPKPACCSRYALDQ